MRLLIVNPNTSIALTERLREAAAGVAAATTELVAVTAPRGFPYIATRAEATLAGSIVLEMLATHAAGADAVVIAAFGDPGLAAARELLAVPVVGMAEAAMLTACMLGRRFAIVTFAEALLPWFQDCVEQNGLAGRCAGFCADPEGFARIDTVQEEKERRLAMLARQAVRERGADVVIFAGAPLAGLAERVKDEVPVPVLDGITAAVLQAQALATIRPRKPLAGGYRRPQAKPALGLGSALAALFGDPPAGTANPTAGLPAG